MSFLTSPPLLRLAVAQALYWSCSIVGITLTLVVGRQLAPAVWLASLPLALLVLTYMVLAPTLARQMAQHGRRAVFIAGAACGVMGGLSYAAGVQMSSFALFCAGSMFLGVYQGTAMSYRYAALESAPPEGKGRAASLVLAGGIAAAVVGPVLASFSREILPVPFIGAYLMLSVLAVAAMVVLAGLPRGVAQPRPDVSLAMMRALLQRPAIRAAVLATACGHGMMILVMNATPVSMVVCGHSTGEASWVVQGHVLGMFLPALVSGWLVDRLGSQKILLLGAVLLLTSGGVALSGSSLEAFAVSSLLLGAGWNVMLVAGTTLLGLGHDPQERPAAQGLMELTSSASAAVASLAAAVAVAGGGWSWLNGGMMALVAVVAVVLLMAAPRLVVPAPVTD
ncbi:MFS transporter [Insolitispirillum peregrinum]|uniref:MFS transporter n=1 Tax=Insolitispirillum peregrinum TaxID=80876 RepID=UPI0036123254